MYNELVLVSVTKYSGTDSLDKNGKEPVMLQILAGKSPNRNVIAGTVAESLGVQIGHSYLLNCRFAGNDTERGDQYTWTKVGEITDFVQVAKLRAELGNPTIFNVPKGSNVPERKSHAVIGQNAERAAKGLFKSAVQSAPSTSGTEELTPGQRQAIGG